MKKVAFLCSGGVDSTVGMALLKEQNYAIRAFYIKIWLEDELNLDQASCPWQEDIEYVRKSCELLNIDYAIVPLQQEYQRHIIRYILNEVQAARTPNPDILCNQLIKFGAFVEYLKKSNFTYDKIASGHYAGVRKNKNGKYELLCSPDKIKDQSYFLAHLNQKQLASIHFPLQNYTKKQVRQLAKKYQLPTAERKDSQGLCFLGKLSFHNFLAAHLGKQKGKFIEIETGHSIGNHDGFWNYTIGQRRKLGLDSGPWYVCAKDPQHNRIYISRHYYATFHKRDTFMIRQPHWIGEVMPDMLTTHWRVKLRHAPTSYRCHWTKLSSPSLGIDATKDKKHDKHWYRITIDAQDQGIAPGQFAVFYNHNVCLGCAMILPSPINSNQYTFSSREDAAYTSLKSDAFHPA